MNETFYLKVNDQIFGAITSAIFNHFRTILTVSVCLLFPLTLMEHHQMVLSGSVNGWPSLQQTSE